MGDSKKLLHGSLHATIFEAKDIKSLSHGFFGSIAHGIGGIFGANDSHGIYATIDLDKARVGRTRIKEHDHIWDESFHIYCAHQTSDIIFTVKFTNAVGAINVGRAYLPVGEIYEGEEVDKWLEICDDERNPVSDGSQIHVKIQFFDISKDRSWARGVRSAKYPGVPYSFFPQRQGCKVSLYQDAHVPDNFLPRISLDSGIYEPHRCWEDIFDAISNAEHLIYIAGWSVYTEITLIRDANRRKSDDNPTLGELLKRKAGEGVRVLMLVWDDRTSVDLLKRDGLMATHDEETENYFKDSEVHCVLCPRNPDDGGSIVQNLQKSTMFTHHQKIVVVDNEMPSSSQQRRILSFIGGIDLCDGRYDTQSHSLFRTLSTIHKDDFHQPNFTGGSITKGGPREPWHDIHCKLEGIIAWDVLYNFEQRWEKQGGNIELLHNLKVGLVGLIVPPSPVMLAEDKETWNVQLFRSIDEGAAAGFPQDPKLAANHGLTSGKNNTIDRGIQDAYINAIRRAKNFIYIENQYFLGSSFGWEPDGIKVEDIGALHLIPKELSLKIVSKIEAGERFTVYVVVPMWPEGIPESASVQAILDWQRRTMQMMYKDIKDALERTGTEADVKSYLTFFCLGNREKQEGEEESPTETPEEDSDYIKAQRARRFMIYVHSKMMIVDDEYIIIGSANINQRSMDGARDSEIAMGAYQPQHLATSGPALGQIHGFRMALWYEHLGAMDEVFKQPESVECVEKVNRMAQHYWNLYSDGEGSPEEDLPGHLLAYPIEVTTEGVVTSPPGMDKFPDTQAPILGTKSDYLPPILTT